MAARSRPGTAATCRSFTAERAMSGTRAARELGQTLLAAAQTPGPLILDVRDAPAFAAGHFEGSGHLPESEWEARRSELPPREREVIVVAESGAAARAAARHLVLLGY